MALPCPYAGQCLAKNLLNPPGARIYKSLGCISRGILLLNHFIATNVQVSIVVLEEVSNNLTVREVIAMLLSDGWYLARVKGSHRQFKHTRKPGIVTVAGKLSEDLAIGTLKNIFKQAELKGQ